MISDEERRDVAEGLRGLEGECVPLAYVLDELGVDCDGADVPKAHVERLADLIDRPTCHFQSEAAVHGIFSLFGICTRCGAIVDPLTAFCSDNRLMPANFCPCCGAEVMHDDY